MKPRKTILQLLAIVTFSLALAACSGGGGSGGTASGTGSSSIEGTVTSANLALLDQQPGESSLLADLIRALTPVTSAFADGGVSGIEVEAAGLRTTTDSSGYFRLDGVPPGNHQVTFRQNGQTAQTTVQVGTGEMVTMQGISLQGSQAHVRSFQHTPMSGFDQDTDSMGPQSGSSPYR